jgi:hypothetical protein
MHGMTLPQQRSGLPLIGLYSPREVVGAPQEQLALVVARLAAIESQPAPEHLLLLSKGSLLLIAKERGLHKVAGAENFGKWAAGVANLHETYVFELIEDVRRANVLNTALPALSEILVRASSRKVVYSILVARGIQAVERVMDLALTQAGGRRPTTQGIKAAARTLGLLPEPSVSAMATLKAWKESSAQAQTVLLEQGRLREAHTAEPAAVAAMIEYVREVALSTVAALEAV